MYSLTPPHPKAGLGFRAEGFAEVIRSRIAYYIGDLTRDPNLQNYLHAHPHHPPT